MPAHRECVLTTSRPPRCHNGSLEQTIHAIRAHRPFDLNAERWREAHPGADFETWRRQAHACLHEGLHYHPGALDFQAETFETEERDGLVVESIAFNTTPWNRLNGYFLKPENAREPLPRARRLPRLGWPAVVRQGTHRQHRPGPSRPCRSPGYLLQRSLNGRRDGARRLCRRRHQRPPLWRARSA